MDDDQLDFLRRLEHVTNVFYLPHLSPPNRLWRVGGTARQARPVASLVLKREFKDLIPDGNFEKHLAQIKSQNYLPPAFVPPFRLPHAGPFDESDRPLPPPMVIRCRTGDIDVITRTVRPHDPAYFATSVIDLDYDPRVKALRYVKFLNRLIPDAGQRETWMRYLGNCLVPERNLLKRFVHLVGPRDCGKSVDIFVFERLVGFENCCHLSVQQLGSRFGLIETVGKLVNIANETSWPTRGEEQELKAIVGSDSRPAEVKGGETLSIIPSVRLIIISNTMVHYNDPDIWGRVIIIQCGDTIPPGQRDRNLREKLLGELPGIFTMLVHAAFRLYRRCKYGLGGFEMTESMVELVDEACNRSDFLREFCRDNFKADHESSIACVDVIQRYKGFCLDGNYRPRHEIKHIKDELDRQYRDCGVDVWRKPPYRILVDGKKVPAIKGISTSGPLGDVARRLIQCVEGQRLVDAAAVQRRQSELAAKSATEAAARVRKDENARRKALELHPDHEKIDEIIAASNESRHARKMAEKVVRETAKVTQEVAEKAQRATRRMADVNARLNHAIRAANGVAARQLSEAEQQEIEELAERLKGGDE